MIEAIKTEQEVKIQYALWHQWNAREYLKTYFDALGQDSYENLKFLVKTFKKYKNKPKQKILDFGSGPTIFSGLVVAPYASEIHMCDYLDTNLSEIRDWLKSNVNAYDWKHVLKHILELENEEISNENIARRELLVKKNTTRLDLCDASLPAPLGRHDKYPIVISNFCPDSATCSKEMWKFYMENISNLVAPSGLLVIAALRNCSFYKINNHFFPCANINEVDLFTTLQNCGFKDINVEACSVPKCANEGFTSVMFSSAIKKTNEDLARSIGKKSSFANIKKLRN